MPVYTTQMRRVMRMMDTSVLITWRKRGTWYVQHMQHEHTKPHDVFTTARVVPQK